MCASGTIFDGADHPLNVGDVLVRATGVDEREELAKGFKLLVSKESSNVKTPMTIETQDGAELVTHGGDFAIWEVFYRDELQGP